MPSLTNLFFWVVLLSAMNDTRHRSRGQRPEVQSCVSVFSDRRELVAHMEAALQRTTTQRPVRPVQIGPLSICRSKRVATWQGKALALSPKEFDILAILADHAGRVVSRTFLFSHLWSADVAGEERLVDRHVMKLRQKLQAGASLIETVWGVGYRLAVPLDKPARKSKAK